MESAEKADRAPPGVAEDFEHSEVAARNLIDAYAPGAKLTELPAVFHNRASYGVIRAWRDGRRPMPQWAVEMVRQHAARLERLANKVPAGPGRAAGMKNLKRGGRNAPARSA